MMKLVELNIFTTISHIFYCTNAYSQPRTTKKITVASVLAISIDSKFSPDQLLEPQNHTYSSEQFAWKEMKHGGE